MTTIKEFIEINRKFDQTTIVMGNQACDLDSLVSAITLAYWKYRVQKINTVGFIPIKRDELLYRTEIAYLLNLLKIHSESFVMLDELDLLKVTQCILVDHNLPTGPFVVLSPVVEEIVDHHEDMKGDFPNLKSKQIEFVGSCTTLVAEKFIKEADYLLDDTILCELFINTILLDTINLDPAMRKVTPKDEWVVQHLAKKLNKTENFKDQMTAIYNPINKAKKDISSLTTTQLLIRDYKEWTAVSLKYGIASVLLPVNQLIERPDFYNTLKKFLIDSQLDVLMVLTAFSDKDNIFHRELLYIVKEDSIGEKLCQKLQADKEILNLIRNPSETVWYFTQQNLTSSRKQVQPLVHKILSTEISKI